MQTQNYKNDIAGKLYIAHSDTKRTYIFKRGSTTELSGGFRKLFRDGIIVELPEEMSHLFYNRFTKRIVKKTSIFRLDGRFKSVFQKKLDAEAINLRAHLQAYHQSEWGEIILKLITNKDLPFKLILTSGRLIGVTRELDFTSWYHMNSWLKNLINADYSSGSDNIKKMNDDSVREGFDYALISVRPIEGGCNKCNGVSQHITEKIYDNERYTFTLFNPKSQRNDCGFKCLEELLDRKLNIPHLRKKYGLTKDSMVPLDVLYNIYMDEKTACDKLLMIINEFYEEKLELENFNIILNMSFHYYIVKNVQKKKVDDICCKRGKLSLDFESRPTEEFIMIGKQRSYLLAPTICGVHYKFNREADEKYKTILFTTTREKNSSRQFIEWLGDMFNKKHKFQIVAFNGSRFDYYFLLQDLKDCELITAVPQFRGKALIGLQYLSNLFRDPNMHMTGSLSKLCESFNVEQKKLKTFELNGITLTNENLCFYKPHLSFWEFMDLQNTEPEYWSLYTNYCIHDCIALSQLWAKYCTQVNSVIEKMNPKLLSKCSVECMNTIASISLKLVTNLNVMTDESKSKWELHKNFIDNDREKYDYISLFKRGGVSHCGKPGKHRESVSSVDITSQYPTALLKAKIPSGASKWVDAYDASKHGYYHIKNLVFDESQRNFKPIAYKGGKNESLVWNHTWKPEDSIHLSSQMIKFCLETQGLLSFDVISGLVSKYYIKGYQIGFGRYVNVLFDEKAQQDVLKENKDPSYNKAFREVCKLLLNSLTGKLVENYDKYSTISYTGLENTKLRIGGVGINKEKNKPKINQFLGCGIAVYDHSKELLFRYLEHFEEKADVAIACETDSIYYPTSAEPFFINSLKEFNAQSGDEFPIAFGTHLGSIKREVQTQKPSSLPVREYCTTSSEASRKNSRDYYHNNKENISKRIKEKYANDEGHRDKCKENRKKIASREKPHVSYFLAKKFYSLYNTIEDKGQMYKIKGIPLKTIAPNGDCIKLVDIKVYEKAFKGKEQVKKFCTLNKNLYGDTSISAHYMSRTITSDNSTYEEYLVSGKKKVKIN